MRFRVLSICAGVAAITVALVGISPLATAQHEHRVANAGGGSATPAVASVKPAPPGPLPALPYDGYPAPRPMPLVQSVYEFAARHPEVLNYMPCFCGCDRSANHKANHDCFVKRRAADGRILEWDSHGYGCAICIDVARDAMQMHNSGATVSSIRAAIDTKYGKQFPVVTMATPKPPVASKTSAAPKK